MASSIEFYDGKLITGNFQEFPSAANLEGWLAVAKDQNNKLYQAIGGQWKEVSPSILSGTSAPDDNDGMPDGTIYIQTV